MRAKPGVRASLSGHASARAAGARAASGSAATPGSGEQGRRRRAVARSGTRAGTGGLVAQAGRRDGGKLRSVGESGRRAGRWPRQRTIHAVQQTATPPLRPAAAGATVPKLAAVVVVAAAAAAAAVSAAAALFTRRLKRLRRSRIDGAGRRLEVPEPLSSPGACGRAEPGARSAGICGGRGQGGGNGLAT